MKIIVTADIHNGYPGRLDDTIWAMNKISRYAEENDINNVIVLGDMFHNREHISIDVLNAVTDFLDNKPEEQEWIMFPGNHDMFMKTSWDINSIKPLSRYAKVINKPAKFAIGERTFWVLPFMHFEDEYMEVMRSINEKCDEGDVLLTHVGVNNAVNNSCFLLKYWSKVNFSDTNFGLILSGHFHNYQVIDDKICYPGSPIPFKFDEGMVDHGFLVIDVDELFVEFVNIRDGEDGTVPDFVTCLDEDVDSVDVTGNRVRVNLNREYSEDELRDLRNTLIDKGALSVQWMKKSIEDNSETPNIAVESALEGGSVFEQWMESKDLSDYDDKLLKSLNVEVSTLAEDLYMKSEEDEE